MASAYHSFAPCGLLAILISPPLSRNAHSANITNEMSNQVNITTCPLPTENPYILNIQDFYGYNLIGSFFSSAVWGVSCLQLFIFYMKSELDPTFLKILLVSLWVLDTVNEVLMLKSNWPVLILQYGRIAGLGEIQPELMHHVWVQFTVTFIVQLYFIYRIYKFSIAVLQGIKLNLIGTVIALLIVLAIAQPVLMIVYEVYGYGKPLSIIGSKREMGINLAIRGLAVFVDVFIAVAMVYLLRYRQKGRLSSSRRMVSRLMIIVVSSGSLTAVLSVIILVLVAIYPNNLHYVMFDYALTSIYFSTLLANLNSRSFVRGPDVVAQNIGSADNTLVLRQMDNSREKNPSQVYIKVESNSTTTRPSREGFTFAHSETQSVI
ncbi:hypothetical protein E4T56_gene547 [Termitomyces sp. T112]|nr:hypothetical protein E4T56_gene547 [Termitomyces sp. T112]